MKIDIQEWHGNCFKFGPAESQHEEKAQVRISYQKEGQEID